MNASPMVDVKPSILSPNKTTKEVYKAPEQHTNCKHQPKPLWTEESITIKHMTILLESIESGLRLPFNLTGFCLQCHSGTGPKILCLNCGGCFCYFKKSDHHHPLKSNRCYEIHNKKNSKCSLGIDMVCREFVCLVCGDLIRPDDWELKIISKKLFSIKKPSLPSCLSRTTQHIFPPRGFSNLGKSCYMNAILQILLRIPEFQCYLLMDHHNRDRQHPTDEDPLCCACELVNLLQGTVSGDRFKEITPVGFLYTLWMNSGDGEDFAGYKEGDAHECLLACLNQIHSTTQGSNPLDTTCHCPIHLLFRCELKSELICGNCDSTSHKVDPILDLSLEIAHLTHLEQLRLVDCLESFTTKEALKEKCYTCAECQMASPVTTKSLKISKLPHILCIQLKRFEHQVQGTSVKLDRFVQFPLMLDMRPYTVSPRNPNDPDQSGYFYKLTGIVRHQGSATSGHYQVIVCQDELYFSFSDANVTVMRLKDVLAVEAYILVYSAVSN